MAKKQPNYEQLRHELDSKLLQAHSLTSVEEQRKFVDQTFAGFHKARQGKQISQQEYVRLINRLAAYKGGAYNDYIDTLAGAAQMGMLDLAMQGGLSALSPEESRKRRDTVTGLTGIEPVEPEA